MFGYVRPLRGELKVKDWEGYQAAYCGLCHALKEQCGSAARFILNYDFVFLALLLDEETTPATPCARRCGAHPLRPRNAVPMTESMALCAGESVILTHYKLLDDAKDEGFGRAISSRLINLWLAGSYRRARRALTEFDGTVKDCLRELKTLEEAKSPSLDRTADTFARLLAAAAPKTGREAVDRPRGQLLYQLGRWIYLADAADDLAEDKAKGRYNPIDARFGGKPDMEYIDTTMSHSLALAQSAFQLLPPNRWQAVTENILYLGLPQVQKQAVAGTWHGGRESRKTHERPL